MTVALEFGVCHLLSEFLADAFVILGFRQTAGAIASSRLQALLNSVDGFHILIESDLGIHSVRLLFLDGYIIPHFPTGFRDLVTDQTVFSSIQQKARRQSPKPLASGAKGQKNSRYGFISVSAFSISTTAFGGE